MQARLLLEAEIYLPGLLRAGSPPQKGMQNCVCDAKDSWQL